VPAGVSVAFYANSTLIGTTATTQALNTGQSEEVTVTWDSDVPGDHIITVVADDDGTGTGQLAECSEANTVQQTVSILDVPLVESWNLMSAYVNPFTTDASVVQRPISGTYVVIQGFDVAAGGAQSYYPDVPPEVNTLKEVDAEHGYWVKMKPAGEQGSGGAEEIVSPLLPSTQAPQLSLRVVGAKFAEDRPIELDAGWNLVSFLPRQPLTVTDALQSIDGQYFAVLGYEGGAQAYFPDIDPSFNTLQTMKPLYGYWIKMTEARTLQYPTTAGDVQSPISNLQSPISNAAGVTPTNTWVHFYGTARLADGTPLPVGATVQAVDPDGVLCGVATVTIEGQYGLLVCYGDDSTTPEDEGARPGDVIRLMVDGQEMATAIWMAHGDLVEVNLGDEAVTRPWRLYLPLVRQGDR